MSNHPEPELERALNALGQLGDAIVVIGGDACAANILGTVTLVRRGDETLLGVAACRSHAHVQWQRIAVLEISSREGGAGLAPVVIFRDRERREVFRIFLPDATEHDIHTVLGA